MSDKHDETDGAAQRRDELLLKLLKTPPQPRPKRERGDHSDDKRKGNRKGSA